MVFLITINLFINIMLPFNLIAFIVHLFVIDFSLKVIQLLFIILKTFYNIYLCCRYEQINIQCINFKMDIPSVR